MNMKRIVTIQDISCVGKCSLTVALPIISAMGVETAIVPTAVLSTHTMFNNFTFRDLTDEIEPISAHWQKEGFKFDAIYTGYLGSFEQIKLVSDFFDTFKSEGNIIFVDPVMADNGKLYPAFDEAFAAEMAKLCSKADVIVPNLTEACFMTETPYNENYDEKYITDLLNKLAKLGAKKVVITGVSFDEGKTGFIGMDSRTGEMFSYSHEKVDTSYHGTGDVFSSTAVGALMRGKSLPEALKVAADYTVECIKTTVKNGKIGWYGVDFEEVIPQLVETINK
jgi:pyridoxine kinase